MKERFSRLKMFCLKIETVSHCRYFCQEFFKGRPNHRYQELITRSEQKPFPSSKNSHFLNEANFKTFLMKIRFICMKVKKISFISTSLSLALKQWLDVTGKRPILLYSCHTVFTDQSIS